MRGPSARAIFLARKVVLLVSRDSGKRVLSEERFARERRTSKAAGKGRACFKD
jgi:hypothetical protein